MAASCGDCCQGSIWKDDLHRLLTELNGGDEVKTDEVTAARRLTRSSHAGAHHSGMVRLQRNLGQNHGGHSPRSGCNPPEALTAPCCAARSWTGCCGAPTGTRAARSSCQSCVSFRRGALLSPLLLFAMHQQSLCPLSLPLAVGTCFSPRLLGPPSARCCCRVGIVLPPCRALRLPRPVQPQALRWRCGTVMSTSSSRSCKRRRRN